jgi:hypothetical protein
MHINRVCIEGNKRLANVAQSPMHSKYAVLKREKERMKRVFNFFDKENLN